MSFIATAIIGGSIAGLGGAAIASHGANKAANTQANAADQAAQLQKQAADQSLAETQREFNITQGNFQPWLTQGRSALANLGYLMGTLPLSSSSTATAFPGGNPSGPPQLSANVRTAGGFNPDAVTSGTFDQGFGGDPAGGRFSNMGDLMTPGTFQGSPGTSPADFNPNVPLSGAPSSTNDPNDLSQYINPNLGSAGSLMQPFTEQFQAPDALTEQNDPGFQARLKLGTDALDRSAASRGGILSGGAARDLDQFAQDYASNEYSNVYNRAFNNYSTKYNIFKQNQADQFNRLSSLAGGGQVAAGQLGTLGTNNANSIASILMNSSANIGQQLNNAGAARASGYAAGSNAYGSAFGSLGNLGNLFTLSKILQPGGGGGSPAGFGGFAGGDPIAG